MLRVTDKDQGILPEWNRFDLRVASRIGYQSEVRHVADDIFIDLIMAAVLEVDIDARMFLEESLDVGRKLMQPDRVNAGQADIPGDDVLNLLHPALKGIVVLQDLLAVIVNQLAFGREPEILFASFNQQRFELPL